MFGKCPCIPIGCGLLTTFLSVLSFPVFIPAIATEYHNSFTSYTMEISDVKCVDITNKLLTYPIGVPTNPLMSPPTSPSTELPTMYQVSDAFWNYPYYELHAYGNASTSETPSSPPPPPILANSHDIKYDLRFRFMNDCGDFGTKITNEFTWENPNSTKASIYVYYNKNNPEETYPFAFSKYDPVIPYWTAGSFILTGVLIMGYGLILYFCSHRRVENPSRWRSI